MPSISARRNCNHTLSRRRNLQVASRCLAIPTKTLCHNQLRIGKCELPQAKYLPVLKTAINLRRNLMRASLGYNCQCLHGPVRKAQKRGAGPTCPATAVGDCQWNGPAHISCTRTRHYALAFAHLHAYSVPDVERVGEEALRVGLAAVEVQGVQDSGNIGKYP